jgi:small GTP-binding protein
MAWKDALADARAMIEADLDFSDEDDVPGSVVDSLPERLSVLLDEMAQEADNPIAERLRDGFRVVLAGAPNSGKSTLLNALLERDAALVSPIAGTTRDQIDVPIDLNGLPVVLSDTAGLREAGHSNDPIETMGIERSRQALASADCIVWLEGGDVEDLSPVVDWREKTIRIRSKADVEVVLTFRRQTLSCASPGRRAKVSRRCVAQSKSACGDAMRLARRRDRSAVSSLWMPGAAVRFSAPATM